MTRIESERTAEPALARDYESLGERLARRGIAIDRIKEKAAAFGVAVPVVGRRHRRHALRPLPRTGRAARHLREARGLRRHPPADRARRRRVSLHIPWDKADDRRRCARRRRTRPRLRRDELQHLPGPARPAAHLQVRLADPHRRRRRARRRSSTTSSASRSAQAIGSKALTVWIGDGSNFPGQSHLTRAFERYLDAMRAIYAALPDDWRLFSEHKMYEPAFYATVVAGLGHQLPDRPASSGPRPSASSTSATMRRTSTSR